jgi:hypothetical protein
VQSGCWSANGGEEWGGGGGGGGGGGNGRTDAAGLDAVGELLAERFGEGDVAFFEDAVEELCAG